MASFNFAALKASFFDAAKVQDEAERARVRGLSRQGAFIRTRARRSIRKRKKSAAPGSPPSSHAGQLKLIFFGYDARSRSVVVGPVLFRGRGGAGAPLLEFGGTTARKGKRVYYRGNPFMRPAEEAERAKFADQFKG